MTDFYGPIAGIRRNDGSVCQTVTTELVYERKGADIFHPLLQARTEFAVEVKFQSGENASVEVMPASQLDDLIAQLQAIKGRVIEAQYGAGSMDLRHAFEDNNKAYELMLVTRAAADKRAQWHQLNADLNTMLHGEMPNGKKVSTKRRLEAIDWTVKELDEVKAELDKLEAAVTARSE